MADPIDTRRRNRLGGLIAATMLAALAVGAAAPAQAQEDQINPLQLGVEGPLGDIVLGDPDAPVTMYEYASMTCSFCAAFHRDVYPDLVATYVDTGQVKFIIREFPLDSLAAAGFMLARCAADDLGPAGYYGMIELLFERRDEWIVEEPLEPMRLLARQAGFTDERFEACLANQEILDAIYAVYDRAAEEFGISATPTFFINGTRYEGVQSMEMLAAAIDPLL